MVENPPDWLLFWASQVGADLKDGIRENPSYIAFGRPTNSWPSHSIIEGMSTRPNSARDSL